MEYVDLGAIQRLPVCFGMYLNEKVSDQVYSNYGSASKPAANLPSWSYVNYIS